MNKKGFTLIELLAVIVILGLLMAIAIPSVTKYITQSRKKTLASTMSNYMKALTNEVNNMDYTFTATNTIYAVPIDCIAVESGGTDPFGAWHNVKDGNPANVSTTEFAYVLVQYDDTTSSYTYGFTFRDSAGYGIVPTASTKLQSSGKQIQTDLALTLANIKGDGKTAVGYYDKDVWNANGFKVDDSTYLKALTVSASSDGITTCTIAQK